MKIFVAGATGTLGIPLVRELVIRGHTVIGLTRVEEKRAILEKLGAGIAVADAMDTPALIRAVYHARPDAVIHLLTAIPRKGPMRAADMVMTNNLRIKGTRNLLTAAKAAGARRFIAESMIFAYGYGDLGEARKTEDDPLPPAEPLAGTRDTVDALRSLENQVIEASRKQEIEGILLRFGLLYGPGVPTTESNLHEIRLRKLPVVGRGDGTKSWVHRDDAVTAIIGALERGRSGQVYNIVDDEPASYREFLIFAAETIGAPRPRSVPLWFLRLTAPYASAFFSTRVNVSNEKAKRELDWHLLFPGYKDGIKEAIRSADREKKAA